MYNSKDQASGLSGLDSNTLLKINEIPYLGNKISIYVDSKYNGLFPDGSMIKPHLTITEALNSIETDENQRYIRRTNIRLRYSY